MRAFSFPLILSAFASLSLVSAQVPFIEKYFTQIVDHFDFSDSSTFQHRYLVQDKWWNKQKGPIFFYAGNEGPIEAFWDNSGFIFDIAPSFGAYIIFPEHRYYGKSLPYGNNSFTTTNIRKLSIEQALADYAVLLVQLKKDLNTDVPIIAFGGSYGGELAAYMRFKYPNIVHGAIAASAPILYTANAIPTGQFFADVTSDFAQYDPNCVTLGRLAFSLGQIYAQQQDFSTLSTVFNLCNPITDMAGWNHLIGWIRNAFTMMAMMDYPYATSFMSNLPAFPVNVACKAMLTGGDVLGGLRDAAGVFYNTTGDLKCYDIYTDFVECADPTGCGLGPDSLAWDYQSCTEMNMLETSDFVHDMFPALPWNADIRTAYCQKVWQVTPRNDWASIEFWNGTVASSSNIVFSNGNLDPWHGGGILKNVTDSVVAVLIQGGAHHLDLRGSNPADPPSVKDARTFEVNNIQKWINQFWTEKRPRW